MAESHSIPNDGARVQSPVKAPIDPNTIARRSISIFSRKGAELPEPKSPLFTAEEVASIPRLSKRLSERQARWLGKKKGISGSNLKKNRGTVLHAVPAAARDSNMTALEEEMSTSPNSEILTAVMEQPPPGGMVFANLPNTLSTFQQKTLWSTGSTSPAERSNSTKRREQANRIGVWVSGVTHWDEKTGATARKSNSQVLTEPAEKPIPIMATPKRELSVSIPSNQLFVNETAIATVVTSITSRARLCVTPPSAVSKFSATPPTSIEEGRWNAASLPRFNRRKSSIPPSSSRHLLSYSEKDRSPASENLKTPRPSSSSCSSVNEHDDASVNSGSSSATSIADNGLAKILILKDTTVNKKADQVSPVNDRTDQAESSPQRYIDKPLPPIPMPSPILYEPVHPPPPNPQMDFENNKLHIAASIRSAPGVQKASAQQWTVKSAVFRRSVSVLDRYDQEFITSCPLPSDISKSNSPTMSEAESKLRSQLSQISVVRESQDGTTSPTSVTVGRGDSVRSVMQPPERAPTVPRRSRKREWCRSPQGQRLQPENLPFRSQSESELRALSKVQEQAGSDMNVDESSTRGRTVRRTASESCLSVVKARTSSADAPEPVLPVPQIVIDDGLIVVKGPRTVGLPAAEVEDQYAAGAASAEDVLLHILQALKTPQDLFNTAHINKGMYRVYRENAMDLIRAVSYNQSPAAWEFREWCPPQDNGAEARQIEYTPVSYTNQHNRDLAVIESLKKQILGHCQSFIRRETAFAISTSSHPNAQRFTDALWRIWAFCEIFGGKKGRLEDVTGQLDWLRGGLLAENQGCVATVNTNLDYELSSVLLNAPDFFAKGNPEGLSAKQLYDMTEIWTCLTALLSGYHGRIGQARDNGVFDGCDVQAGDVEKEGQLLEEWLNHILTLGPAVIAEMVEHANDNNGTGFTVARRNGWTVWSPPQYNASRATFLKEPVSRLYEERVIAAAIQSQSPFERERKEMSRKRVATLAAEIRLARQASSYKRLPLIDMYSERAMSMIDRGIDERGVGAQDGSMSATEPRSYLVSPLLPSDTTSPPLMAQAFAQTSPSLPPTPLSAVPPSPSRTAFVPPLPPRRQHRRPPRITITHHQRKISPIIEDRVETFNRMSLRRYGNGIAEDTSGMAVKKIVEMGFTPAQASEALRVTDMGDGLRVDRAVDLLIRGR